MIDQTIMWQPEDAKALAKARESTGMSRAEFARALCISEKQLTQLEEGGSKSFYSERIKYQKGQRILAQFGLTPVQEKETPEEKKTAPLEKDFKTEAVAQLDSVIETNNKRLNEEDDQPIFQLRKGYLLLAMLVLFVSAAFMLLPQKTAPKPAMKAAPEARNAPPKTTVASESLIDAPPAAATGAPLLDPLPGVQHPTQAAEAAECQWTDTPLRLKPIGNSRPPDRVYLVANSDLVVCLKDGANQVQQISLKGGDRQLIQGSGAPWLIYSPQMVYLKVFFQGFHVFIPGADTRLIKLETYP